MTGPDDIAPAEPTEPAIPTRPRLRRRTLHPVRGRWTVVGAIVVVVVGVAAVSAAFPPPAPPSGPPADDAVTVSPADAYSSSLYCPAATDGAASSTIYLTNTTTRTVAGVMTAIAPARRGGVVPTVRRPVEIPPLGTSAVAPSTGLPAGSNAAAFTFAGGGVVGLRAVSGPLGWSTAPCASQTSPTWYFAGGSTVPGDGLSLALFNPTASQSVVDISFLTASGLVTPQAYQGLVVQPGRLVVATVGQFVQRASSIATFVTSQSGSLVSTEFQQTAAGGKGLSLRLGAPGLSDTWRFAQTTAGPGSKVSFLLGNRSTATVTGTISIGLPSGTVVPREVSIPPLSVLDQVVSGVVGLPQRVPYSVTVHTSAPVVVGRTVLAATGAVAPRWGSSSGTVTVATHWVIPGPGVVGIPGTPGATVESLAVADPGPNPAQVVVSTMKGVRPLASFEVAPGRVAVLGPKLVGQLRVYTVSSSQPVNVEEDSRPSGAPGVVSSTGFPIPT